jgi:hypothetical protein
MTTATVSGLTTTHSYDPTGARTAASTGAGAANTTKYNWDKRGHSRSCVARIHRSFALPSSSAGRTGL